MLLTDSRTGTKSLDQTTCLRLLASKQVGRLGFVSNGNPEILPVNYVIDGEAVVFATASGAKLWGTTHSSVVFEVDDTDPETRSGWSVIIHGLAQELIDCDATGMVERVRALGLHPWPSGDKSHLVRIAPRSMTGRRIPPEG